MKVRFLSLLVICIFLISCASAQKKYEREREKDPQFLYNRGNYFMSVGNIDEAIKYFKKSLAVDSRYYLSYNSLGLAHSMNRNFQESLNCFQKCLEINPKFTEARNNLGMVYQVLGLIERAEEAYRTALLDTEYKSKELLYFGLAQIAFSKNNWEEALDNSQKAIQANPRMALVHNGKGQVLEKLDRLPEAIESYEQALKIVPEDISFNFNLGAAYFKTGEYRKAREIFEKILPRVQDLEMRNKINEYLKTMK